MIITSSPGDWERLERLGGPGWPDGHHYLAVYKPDVSLRLAWGFVAREDEPAFRDWHFSTPVEQHLVDALWHGALVARWPVLAVDNVHGYLPDPRNMLMETGEPGQVEHVAWTVKASETALPRLLQLLVPPQGPRNFDSYLEQSGIQVVDG